MIAVGHAERSGIDAKALCGKLDKDCADLRAGKPQRRAAVLDRLAAGGDALVRRLLGVAGNHLHPAQRQVEFLRRDLRQRRHDALAELDLAGADSGVAVGADANPGVEQAVVVEAAGQPCGCCAKASRGANVKASVMPPSPAAKSRREIAFIRSSRPFAPPSGPRGRCGYACRSGTDCRQALAAHPPRSAADCGRAAPSPT